MDITSPANVRVRVSEVSAPLIMKPTVGYDSEPVHMYHILTVYVPTTHFNILSYRLLHVPNWRFWTPFQMYT
jgi:hypothetical protein